MTDPTPHARTCPLPRAAVVDRYFLEHRGKLLDLAAFLDRIDRAQGATDADHDPRVAALLHAVALLNDGEPDRVRRIQLALSDPTDTPLDNAPPGPAHGTFVRHASEGPG